MLKHFVESTQGALIIRLQGRLDQSGCDMLSQVFDKYASKQTHIVLDLHDVDYLSSSTLSLLVQIARGTPREELKLALAAVQPHVREALQFSNLNELLPIYKTVEDAISQVATLLANDETLLSSNRVRDLLLRYLMLIQYGQLERLEDFVHIDITVDRVSPNRIEQFVGVHALRVDLSKTRREGGVDIEISTIIAQPDAVSAWMIERTKLSQGISSGNYCALLARMRGDRISHLQIIRGPAQDQI